MIGVLFIVFFVFLGFAVPIAIAMAFGAWAPILLGAPGISGVGYLIRNAFSGADTTPIIAVPLFILAGAIMAEGGISRKLFDVFACVAGKRAGGLPCAVIMTCLFYGAISGSGPATTAAVGAMAIPFMEGLGYDKAFCAAIIAVSGGLGVIIPPSIPFVLYSLATGVSTGSLFMAGILPGIFIGICLMACAVWQCRKKGEDKVAIGEKVDELKKFGFIKLLRDSFWALLSPVIVLGGIYSGFFTPTEAACVSVFYSFIISIFVYKSVTAPQVLSLLRGAVKTYTPLLFIIAFAVAFGRVLTLLKAPALISDYMLSTFGSKITVLAAIVVVFFVIGMVMDQGPAIVIMAPLLLPIVSAMGVDPTHFGVIMVVNLSIGLATPPFGLDLFVAGTLAGLPPMAVAKKALPFIAVFAVAIIAITYLPPISLLLPGCA